MTTNQTIDGVSRELLERVAAEADHMLGFTYAANCDECRAAVDELHALLDEPAESQRDTVPVSARWTDWSMVTLEIDGRHRTYVECGKPAPSQSQGEPVATDERARYDAWCESNLGYVRPFNKYEWSAWQARAQLAEQPAPVSMCDCNQGRLPCNRGCKP